MKPLLLLVAATLVLGGCGSRSASRSRDDFAVIAHSMKPSVALLTDDVPSDDPKARGARDDEFATAFVVESDDRRSVFVTAEHAIEDARDIRLQLAGRKLPATRVLRADKTHDLALLEVATPGLVPLPLSREPQLDSGDPIGLVGFPVPDAFEDEGLGVTVSVYSGRVASRRPDAYELDLPVIPGESGGPVFDARTGAVIGVAESRFDDERAIGFAVPSNDVARLLQTEHIMSRGRAFSP